MITVQIRKQGGAAIMTVPSDILKLMNIEVGSILELTITKQGLLARPSIEKKRKRYTLTELLRGSTKKNIKRLNKQTEWAREGKAIGRELS